MNPPRNKSSSPSVAPPASGGISDFPAEELAKILRVANVASAPGARSAPPPASARPAASRTGSSAHPVSTRPPSADRTARPAVRGPIPAGFASGTPPVRGVSGQAPAPSSQATGRDSSRSARPVSAPPATTAAPSSRNASGQAPAASASPQKTKHPSWKERQRQNSARKSSSRAPRQAPKKAAAPTSEPSDLTKFMLVASGMLDDLMDVVTWIPGISAVFATMSATIQAVAIMTDPNLLKQSAGDKAKLLLKRWLLIATASLIEGLAPVVNMLPLQTLAGWAVRYIKKKEKAA